MESVARDAEGNGFTAQVWQGMETRNIMEGFGNSDWRTKYIMNRVLRNEEECLLEPMGNKAYKVE